jgi:hypothetical protein
MRHPPHFFSLPHLTYIIHKHSAAPKKPVLIIKNREKPENDMQSEADTEKFCRNFYRYYI